MKDDLILGSLIDLYKERGIDLHLLLDEPLFQKLPIDSQVALIKKYAGEISDSTARPMSSKDVKSMLLNAAAGAGIVSVGVYARNMMHGMQTGYKIPTSLKGLAIAAGAGAGVGVIKSLIDQRSYLKQRSDMNSIFSKVRDSQSNSDAIKALGIRHLQTGRSLPVRHNFAVDLVNKSLDSALPVATSFADLRSAQSELRSAHAKMQADTNPETMQNSIDNVVGSADYVNGSTNKFLDGIKKIYGDYI